ncbi:MAG: chemotaxis protein CheR [Bacteroidetes bacterium 4572_77]|nr:MAG: chemotaxis protein CheR [Bacteroidetes bacterium 4572_77]
MASKIDLEINDKELQIFLEDIWTTYNIDFREYGKAHIKRRIRHRMTVSKWQTFTEFKTDVLQKQNSFIDLFKDFSINVTELFRDPEFYQKLYQILSVSQKEKPINVWISACASGEEAFSVLMLLEHFNISYYQIVASDFNPEIISQASRGSIHFSKMKDYLKNLEKTDLGIDFEKYFTKHDTYYVLKNQYLEKIHFVTHNLIHELESPKFDLILCRNILIYFEKNLQNTAVNHLTNSLNAEGILCLGAKESLRFLQVFPKYNTIDQTHKIYQKK